MKRKRNSFRSSECKIKRGLPLLLFLLAVGFFLLKTWPSLPRSEEDRTAMAVEHLLGLRQAVRFEDGPRRMQRLFPEGACFTVTLYGLAWTNLIHHFPVNDDLRKRALEEAEWALRQYEEPYLVGPFRSTQVRNGVFWLGQENLVLGQFLRALEETRRPSRWVDAFHDDSESLFKAFMASPTAHLDSYPGMCWPPDNVTALDSLLLHDELYGTGYRVAFVKWKEWTQKNADPMTGLPAGHVDAQSGHVLQPARGCANSWNLALLAGMDPAFSREQYRLYREHFLVKRLGFRAFREYPRGLDLPSDVDSGPILFGAGATATGVGLAASLANGDMETAEDIYDLANLLGLRRKVEIDGQRCVKYLLDRFPVGDAFLAWATTLRLPAHTLTSAHPPAAQLWARKSSIFLLASICFCIALLLNWG